MDNEFWYEESLGVLKSIAEGNESILTISLYGSLSKQEIKKDRWSDIDTVIVVRDETLDLFSQDLGWLSPFGKIFTFHRDTHGTSSTTIKVYFEDFKRMDIVLITESSAKDPKLEITKQRLVFSRDDEIKKILENERRTILYPKVDTYQFDELANDFWYKAVIALNKTIRNDLLVATQIKLGLYRKYITLGIWLRNREVGTHIHRTGGPRNELLKNLRLDLENGNPEEIILAVENITKEFDILAPT